MPDTRKHRGPAPEDDPSTWEGVLPDLRTAVKDYSWLLTRGYAEPSSLKLIGDRFQLTERQRQAVKRCSCSESSWIKRKVKDIPLEEAGGRILQIDGFNILTTLETALGGGLLLRGRDGCLRDLAGVHGTWRRVEETGPALEMFGKFLASHDITDCFWFLDQPVSNSGRLKGILQEIASQHGWTWEVDLVIDPDPLLKESRDIVVTADGEILDHAGMWLNISAALVKEKIPRAWILDLNDGESEDS